MSSRIPPRDPIAAEQRRATSARRVGESARCACGEKRPEALIPNGKTVTCAACTRKRQGKTTMDKHHVAGKANSPVTVSVPVNDHRARLSTDQYDWQKALENRDGSPLLIAAACIRGFIDTTVYLVETLLHWIAGLLVELNEYLIERIGPKWWLKTRLSQTLPEGWSR
jgi:hypothetical protein